MPARSRSSASTRSPTRSRPSGSSAWISDEPMIYDKLTPFEYLEFVAGLWGIDADAPRRARASCSTGSTSAPMPMSAARASPRACARRWRSPARWCTTRDVIILDEPLTGLDAGSARQVKDVLRERVAAGGTVIMTTHILEVAERMADRIGIIAGGTADRRRHARGTARPGRAAAHDARRHLPRSRRRAGQPA